VYRSHHGANFLVIVGAHGEQRALPCKEDMGAEPPAGSRSSVPRREEKFPEAESF